MGHSSRDEYQTAGGDPNLAVAEQERSLTARDVKRLVRVRVDVEGGAGWSAGSVPARTRSPSISDGPKFAGSGPSDGAITVHPLIVSMTADPSRAVSRLPSASQGAACDTR